VRYPLAKALRSAHARTVLRDLPQELHFQLSGRVRSTAWTRLRASRSPADIMQFAGTQVHGGPSQRETEILPMLRMVAEREARTIVELGTGEGGTTLLFSNALPSVSLVVGVSLFVTNRVRLSEFHRETVSLHLIDGSCYAAETISTVKSVLGGRPIDLLFIDGDHTLAGALLDFRSYRGLVAPGGLIAFHDIVPDQRLRGGPPSEAWSGEAPVLWEILRHQYRHWEFVESWNQLGSGIGVLEHDPGVLPSIVPRRHGEAGVVS
jgi:predicted O-methyltransferase YrrM